MKLSLCPHCFCMTKTIKGKCGKCKKQKIKRICVFCDEKFEDTRKGFPKYGICPKCGENIREEIKKK